MQHLVYDQSPDIPCSWYDENVAGRANCRVSNARAVRVYARERVPRAARRRGDGTLTFREYRDGSANKSQLSPLPRNYLETRAPAETLIVPSGIAYIGRVIMNHPLSREVPREIESEGNML